MKRLAVMLSGLLLVASFASTPAAAKQVDGTAAAITIVSTERVSDRVVKYKVKTPSLEMSSSVPLRVNVILPTGYAKNPKRDYPVLYALPGTSNLADVWLKNLDTVNLTRSMPMIIVVPDGTYDADGGGFYTNWVDQSTSRGVANWETFHTQELVKWTDKRFRTIRHRSGRAIVGISQGGFGSLSYAARHTGTYGAAASFSGATSIYYNPICQVGSSLLVSTIMTALNGVQPFAPFGDPVSNAANWKSRDPASIVKNLARTHLEVYSSSGKPSKEELMGDPAVLGTMGLEAVLHVSNKCFKQAADKAGITYGWHEYRVGTHAWMYGDRSLKDYLPRLMKFFAAAKR